MQTWWICFFPLIILCMILASQRKETNQYIAARVGRRKGDTEMNQLAKRYIDEGMSKKEAVKKVSEERDIPKREVYAVSVKFS